MGPYLVRVDGVDEGLRTCGPFQVHLDYVGEDVHFVQVRVCAWRYPGERMIGVTEVVLSNLDGHTSVEYCVEVGGSVYVAVEFYPMFIARGRTGRVSQRAYGTTRFSVGYDATGEVCQGLEQCCVD